MNEKYTEKYGEKRHTGLIKTFILSLLAVYTALSVTGCKSDRTASDPKDIPAPESTIIVEKADPDTVSDDAEDETEAGHDTMPEDTEDVTEAGPDENDSPDENGDTDNTDISENDDRDISENDDRDISENDDQDIDDEIASEEDRFYWEDISDEIFARMDGKSFPADCAVSRDDLCCLHLLHKDLEGNTHEGEMICNRKIADRLTDIFRQLYEADYPIESIRLIDDYDGDDDASMSANNTSCFNYRVVKGTKKISKHGYGLAVDLNPRYNPYVHTVSGQTVIEPENGAPYADRDAGFDYKIDEDDLAYKLFTQAGFTWGGSWKNSKDYQHFEFD